MRPAASYRPAHGGYPGGRATTDEDVLLHLRAIRYAAHAIAEQLAFEPLPSVMARPLRRARVHARRRRP